MDVVVLISEASLVVQLVLFLLVVASLLSWTFIVRRWRELAATARQTDEFELSFWSGNNTLPQLHEVVRRAPNNSGIMVLF